MDVLLPIFLLLIGFGLLLIEVFIPSLGILTIASVGSLAAALVLGFSYSPGLGLSLLAAALFGVPIVLIFAFKFFPDTPLGRHMILARAPGSHPAPATVSDRTELVGREGMARSRLRPSGVAEVEGERLDVVTRGEMIEVGTRIRIIENRGNRIVVRAVGEGPPEPEEELR